MLNSIPDEIKTFCESHLGALRSFKHASGGCINNGGRLESDNATAFVKWNDAKRFPKMFTAEASGLKLLREPGCIDIPSVMDVYEGTNFSCLLLEQIESGPRATAFWERFGAELATLHKTTQEDYGLDINNYMGSLQQANDKRSSLADFFIECRLIPQIEMAGSKLSKQDRKLFESLYKKLPSILVDERPSLVHGDLWSGNFMVGNKGQPVLIDPAVAYSSREVDLAMSRIFGGFEAAFYASYEDTFPTAPGLAERIDIHNLYPLLVHVNLFGWGYYRQVKNILDRFA